MLIYDPHKIVQLREGLGWNQAQLARESKLSQPSGWALEHGKTTMPKFSTLQAVAEALKVDVRDILARRPKGKEGKEFDDALADSYSALSPANKSVLLAVAQSLVAQQKSKK